MIQVFAQAPYSLNDGLGTRTLARDARHGRVETLDVAPGLASNPAADAAIRSRAAKYAELQGQAFSLVRRIEREGTALRLVADAPEGVRLSTLLAHLELAHLEGADVLSDAGMFALVGALVRAVATMHRLPGGMAHGALTPAHVIVARDGSITLTDGAFGAALESLQRNREQLWREFGLALPPAASLPRFDQRADVTQVGAMALAIALRRPLRLDEYPRGIVDLVVAATPSAATLALGFAAPLRMWLQQALQLHARSMFSSAIEAERALAELAAGMHTRRAGVQNLQALVRKLVVEPAEPGVGGRPSEEPQSRATAGFSATEALGAGLPPRTRISSPTA